MRNYLYIFFYFLISLNCLVTKGFQKETNLKILTWNIQDLGRSKDDDELLFISKILKDYDLVAIQEVVAKDPAGAKAVAKIADNLNRLGSKWNYSVSNPTRSSSSNIKERYAYLWKTSKLKLKKDPELDKELELLIEREPYIGIFEMKNGTFFYAINMHAKTYRNHPEIEISNFKKYPKRFQTKNLIILGDFNLNERHSVWNPLYKMGFKPAIRNIKTSIKRKCKKEQYMYKAVDNIIFNSNSVEKVNSGIIDFVKNCNNLEKARLISDHFPVYLEIKMN